MPFAKRLNFSLRHRRLNPDRTASGVPHIVKSSGISTVPSFACSTILCIAVLAPTAVILPQSYIFFVSISTNNLIICFTVLIFFYYLYNSNDFSLRI